MRKRLFLTVPLLAGGLFAAPVLAADNGATVNPAGRSAPNVGTAGQSSAGATRSSGDERRDAEEHVREAMQMVQQMKSDPHVKELLSQAKGVFLVPDYGRGAIGVGASGGAGVMLAKNDGGWSNPLFYNMGAVSIGAQVGASAGQVALILMDDKAVNSFKQDNKFSLDAKAGISIINYSARAEGAAGRGDVVLWSDTEGAFAGASIAISDINFDDDEARAYYGKDVKPGAVLTGKAEAKAPQSAEQLKQALKS